MRLELHDVAIGDGPGAALPPVSATATDLLPGVIAVETLDAPVLASLVAGGRMRPEHGRVTLDGVEDDAAVRAAFALVDTPEIAEPFASLRVDQVAREELALAGHRTDRGTVAELLDAVGLTEHARTRMQSLPAAARLRLLTETALLRPGVRGLVVTSPERHGGDVADWLAIVHDLADRGTVVLVVTSVAAAATVAELTAQEAPVAPDAPVAPGTDDAPPSTTAAATRDRRSDDDAPTEPVAPLAPVTDLLPTSTPSSPTTPDDAEVAPAPEGNAP